MSRQTTRTRAARKEVARAEGFIEQATEETVRRTRSPQEYDFTADDIIKVRDHQAQSWRQVAKVLGLPNPGAARRAYSVLTGVSSHDSQPLVKRQPKGSFSGKGMEKPGWDDDSDQDEIIQRMQGEWHPPSGQGKDYKPGHFDGCLVTIRRNHYGVQCSEDISVARVVSFNFDYNDHLEVEVVDRDNGARRTFYVSDIYSVN